MPITIDIRGNAELASERVKADPIAAHTVGLIKREREIFESSPPAANLPQIRLSSVDLPLSRRSPELPAPKLVKSAAEAIARGKAILKGMEPNEFEDLMITPPSRLNEKALSEGLSKMMLFETIMQLGGHINLIRQVERSAWPKPQLENLVFEAAAYCARLPENNTDKILDFVADNIFRPRGVPLPEDPSEARRHLAVVGTTSMFVHYGLSASLLRKGDICFVPEASFGSFFGVAPAGGGRTEIIPTADTQYRLTASSLRKAIAGLQSGERPRLLLLINPTNPTGYCFTARELREIGAVCIKNKMVMLVDELFSGFEMPGEKRRTVCAASFTTSIAGVTHRLHDHMVTAWGNSKLFGLTSGQLGFAASGNPELIAGIRHVTNVLQTMPSIRDTAMNVEWMQAGLPYIDQVRDPLAQAHRELLAFVEHTNAKLGTEIFRLVGPLHSGFFAGLGVMTSAAKSVGITDGIKLSEYFWRVLGVKTTPTASMRISPGDYIYCRINFVDVDPQQRVEAFTRIAGWAERLRDGQAEKIKFKV